MFFLDKYIFIVDRDELRVVERRFEDFVTLEQHMNLEKSLHYYTKEEKTDEVQADVYMLKELIKDRAPINFVCE